MENQEILAHTQILWDYLKLNQKIEKADCILVLGSHDLLVPACAGELYNQKFAPIICMSGGFGRSTELWEKPEAEVFAKIAIERGVPAGKILIENKASNTGENLKFSYEILKQNKIQIQKIILVQKPYMERRSLATFLKQWPGEMPKVFVTSPQISMTNYIASVSDVKELICKIVAVMERILTYPQKGYQVEQFVPKNVLKSYEVLIKNGFTKFLSK